MTPGQKKRLWWQRLRPRTSTILALGVLAGCLFFAPMIAAVGGYIQPRPELTPQTLWSI